MKKAIKLTFQITVTVLLIALLSALITGGLILFNGLGEKGNFSYLVVLGTTVEGTEPSPMLQDRIQSAAKYLDANPNIICIVTGGKADDQNISEAQCMYNGLTELGIHPDRIRIEDQATTTLENFRYSLDLLEQELGYRPHNIGVLSSEFHLLRARMIAKDYGIQAYTIPANTSDTEAFFKYFLREILMVWYDGLKLAIT